mmetsp:Transcript_53645/g.160605  ORF Transcript_53645/g.160605 Transcript_53645/m.160605 type:complete len:493 (-) Transcript_53645:393-1871(-)
MRACKPHSSVLSPFLFQMDLDQSERQTIEQLKEEEKKSAEDEVYQTIQELQCCTPGQIHEQHLTSNGPPKSMQGKKEEIEEGGDPRTEGKRDTHISSNLISPVDLKLSEEDYDSSNFQESENIASSGISEQRSTRPPRTDTSKVPKPRQLVRVTVKHTPRLFKTPSRESTAKQEQEFITKNRPFLRTNKLLNKDALDISQADPVWLKKKGDDFYMSGDFRSAINAYSTAFEADNSAIQALSNRAACYLQIGESTQCLSDCERALQYLSANPSQFPDQSKFESKLHVRIGTSKCNLGDYPGALQAFERAKALVPTDSNNLLHEIESIKRVREACCLKKQADTKFNDGDIFQALSLYGKSVTTDPSYPDALINRSACYLAAGNVQQCVEDCTSAMHILSHKGKSDGDDSKHSAGQELKTSSTIFQVSVPPPGSSRRRKMVMASFCRRGAAKAQLGDFRGSITDLRSALGLVDPSDSKTAESIRKDIKALKGSLQ